MAGKYFAKATVCAHGHKHDSKREAERCLELHQDQREGRIHGLTVHPKYIIQDSFKHNGKTERAITYSPDFRY